MTDFFEHKGHTFHVSHEHDDTIDAPWERGDGHGPVSEWTTRAKRAGERILASDRGSHRFYDWQEACKLARRDGWDADPIGAPGRIERAVSADFEFLRAWCDDEWHYVGVTVELLDESMRVISSDAVWGIESNATDYLEEVAREIADTLLDEYQTERDERTYWAQRDTITAEG